MGAALPSGSVTFLLTDIEGSTRLFHRLGDRYEPLLDRHNRLLRSTWADHGGAEFKAEGDALLVAFGSAADAFAAAVEGQRRLRAAPWPDDAAIRVRMGLHTGMAYPRDGDYIALALHRAARVVGAGNGGQIVASADAVAAAGTVDGIATRRIGAYRLRDFEGPAILHEVTASGETEDRFPALRAVPAEGHNLWASRDVFVGRVEEIEELTAVVGAGRLVTMLGPGGIGKTRLATEFAREVAPKWGDGVWMLDLAGVPAGEPIGLAVADTLGVAPGDAPALEALVDHLRDKSALLLLDNCEHVLASARELARAVLASCPAAGLLATSRERLGVAGEHTFVVSPLPLTEDCVDLFVDRAQQRDSALRLDEADRKVAFEICRRLDGLPLAIELAAARSNVLTPAEILDSLGNRLAALRRRDDAVAVRQRTLKALIDWSYDLLDPIEQAVFRRLSVFVGSFDLTTAAAAVAHDDVEADDVAEVVWSLVDKSLLTVERQEGSTRYRMLETINAVAAEYSVDAGDARLTRTALGERYLADFPLLENGSPEWRSRMAPEQATLVHLVHPLVDDGQVELAHALARIGVELDIGRFLREAPLRLLLPLLDPAAPRSRGSARLHALVGRMFAEVDDRPTSEAHLDAAVACIEEFGDRDRHGVVLLSAVRNMLALRSADVAELRHGWEALAADLARPLPPAVRSTVLIDIGLAAQMLGMDTRGYSAEAATLAKSTGDMMNLMFVVNNLAEDELRTGDIADAARHQQEAMRLSAELDVPLVTGFALVLAARMAQPAGLDAPAVRLHAAADAIFEELDFTLLPDDRELSDAMLAEARTNLGESYDTEVAVGRSLSLPEVMTAAEEVFEAAQRT